VKRLNCLFEKLATYENLLLAFHKAYRGCNKFAGARIFPHYLRVKKASLKRGLRKFSQRREEYVLGKLSEEQFAASTASIIGHLEFFNSYRLRCSCGQALLFWR
jgi:hypothetical protein